jgi:tetrahydromethanopterin S-methyltransferase subunit A
LYKNGVDGDGRIINSHSPDPILTVSKTEIKKFQSRVRIINKIGITNFEEISSLVHSIQN